MVHCSNLQVFSLLVGYQVIIRAQVERKSAFCQGTHMVSSVLLKNEWFFFFFFYCNYSNEYYKNTELLTTYEVYSANVKMFCTS